MRVGYSSVLGNDWEDVATVRTVPVIEKVDNMIMDWPPRGAPLCLQGKASPLATFMVLPIAEMGSTSVILSEQQVWFIAPFQSVVMEHRAATGIPKQP